MNTAESACSSIQAIGMSLTVLTGDAFTSGLRNVGVVGAAAVAYKSVHFEVILSDPFDELCDGPVECPPGQHRG